MKQERYIVHDFHKEKVDNGYFSRFVEKEDTISCKTLKDAEMLLDICTDKAFIEDKVNGNKITKTK